MNESFLKTQIRSVPDTDWVIWLICIVSAVYIASRLLFPRYYSRISHAFFNWYEAIKLMEEKNVLFNRAGFLLNFIPIFCIAMLVFEQMGYFRHDLLQVSPGFKYLGVLALVGIYYGVRILVIFLFGYSFEQNEIALRFNQLWFIQFQNLGTFIFIPTLILPFTAGVVKIAVFGVLWFAFILWLLYTIIRELELLKSFRISIFYMFLYLCTLEILPMWWAIKSITEGW